MKRPKRGAKKNGSTPADPSTSGPSDTGGAQAVAVAEALPPPHERS
jgi:hypothetical protein